MFGIRFYKGLPHQYIIKYRKGRKVTAGRGLSFYYHKSFTSVVVVPMESREQPFIFRELSSDFQEISIQGQVTYQIREPEKTADLLNLTVDERGYISDDLTKLPERLVNIIQDKVRNEINVLNLDDAISSGRHLSELLLEGMQKDEETLGMGLQVLGLRITSLQPNPETARALEAGIREKILQDADEAIYRRRNSAVEQERIIQENELNTRIAVEEKEREIQAKQIKSAEEKLVAEAKMDQKRKTNEISLEEMNQKIVGMKTDNIRKEGDAEAYRIAAFMKAYNEVNPALLETIKYSGMNPVQIMADGFRELARNNGSIGQLNVTPEILQALNAIGGNTAGS